MGSALHCLLMFSALWTLSLCGTRVLHVVDEEKTWTEAQKYCRDEFTDLAPIENQREMNAVRAALSGKTGFFWVGVRQQPGLSIINWVLSDGSNSSYRDWIVGQPNNPVGDICVQLWSQYRFQWNDEPCGWIDSFVCYEEIPLVLIKQNKTWREALRYCRENHVDLVSVENETIQRWVKTVARNASSDNVWVGLRHTCTLSFWFWVSGNSVCYQNWAPGNGMGVEDCSNGERSGAVQTESRQWISVPENQTLNFICSTV